MTNRLLDHRTVSLSEQVFDRLETDILSGVFARGEIINELKLSEQLGVSRTPVREALHRLLQEHLVEDTQKGLTVLGITKEDVRDIYLLREKIEGLVAARVAEIATPDEIRQLRETTDLQEFYHQKSDADHIREMDTNFHEMIYRFSGSTVFFDTLSPLHRKAQKYRMVSVSSKAHSGESLQEHLAILEAIAAHDPEKAAREITRHAHNAYLRITEDI